MLAEEAVSVLGGGGGSLAQEVRLRWTTALGLGLSVCVAAREQLARGFIWDSVTLTRTLKDRKLSSTLRSSLSARGCPPSTCVRCRRWPGSSTACRHADDPSAGLGMPGGQPLRADVGPEAASASAPHDAPGAGGLHVGGVGGGLTQ